MKDKLRNGPSPERTDFRSIYGLPVYTGTGGLPVYIYGAIVTLVKSK